MTKKNINENSKESTKQNISQNNKTMKHVLFKEGYYGDKLSSYFLLLISSAVVCLFLFGLVFYIKSIEPDSKYFLSDRSGQIFVTFPLDRPMYNEAQIKDWTAQAVIRAFDFNFINYENQLDNVRELFTSAGYNVFRYENVPKILPLIIRTKFAGKLSLCNIASVEKTISGVHNINGVQKYIWLVKLPVYFELRNEKKRYIILAEIRTYVERMSELEYMGGLAISDLRMINLRNIDNIRGNDLALCSIGVENG